MSTIVAGINLNDTTSFPTLVIAAGAVVGDAVAYTAEGTVGRGADGDPLFGKVQNIESDRKGLVNTIGSGAQTLTAQAAVPLGPQNLVVDGAGGVKVGAAGTRVHVYKYDAVTKALFIRL
ncbi:hypothetical protein [Deinococcus sp. QL22]|uniref:hypothetical protein n=1 Tax=Deinococcus sp. QL22 TaxID=2939437 RepID=UPI0020172EA6|nr:hypothetical protein [Deinococcus sp. QL22]UQN10375.1 hypothetical protein M1R55_29935 [Deinococcus sp. QL22]UQN10509.1 hypothetical protein M1R55_29260 [Deinococcus sp. QL22]